MRSTRRERGKRSSKLAPDGQGHSIPQSPPHGTQPSTDWDEAADRGQDGARVCPTVLPPVDHSEEGTGG